MVMDSVLLVCYSYTGTTRRLAGLLASHHGWPLGQVRDTHPRSGTLGCVLDSLLRREPLVTYEGPDPAGFRTVVLMAPIWMYRLASPMRSFVHVHKQDLRRVAVVCTQGAGGASNAVAEIARIIGHAPVATASFLQREVDDGTCTSRLLEFGAALQAGAPKVQSAEHPAFAVPLTRA